jgi:hypothetical protein
MYKSLLNISITLLQAKRNLECRLFNFIQKTESIGPYFWINAILLVIGLSQGVLVRFLLTEVGLFSLIEANLYYQCIYNGILFYTGYQVGKKVGFWFEINLHYRRIHNGHAGGCKKILGSCPKNMRYTCSCHFDTVRNFIHIP